MRRFLQDGYCYHVATATEGRSAVFADADSATRVADALQFVRREKAFLLAYAVMPDHLHMLVQPRERFTLPRVVQSVKGYSSWSIHQRTGRRGRLWQVSFYDRVIRNEAQLAHCIEYIHWNPVKARLVSDPGLYRWSSAFQGALTDIAEFIGATG